MSALISQEITILCDKCDEYVDFGLEFDVIMQGGKPTVMGSSIYGEHKCNREEKYDE